MFAELGIFFLILTFLISSLGFVIPLYSGNLNQPITQTKISKLIFCCTLSSFFLLTYCFITSDFSLEVVQKNSNSQLPMIYKITGVWGNHEGSILLWLLIMTFFGFAAGIKTMLKSKIFQPWLK